MTYVILFLLFVFIKSWNDARYILLDKVVPAHGLEWVMVALAATLAACGYSHNPRAIFVFDLLMVPVTWIAQDIFLNALLRHNIITYVGSGWWDNLFKFHFPKSAYKALWLVKGILFAVCAFLFAKYK